MIHGKPYCHKHRSRFRKYGSFDIPKRPPTSDIEFEGDCLKITTTKGEVILADRSDYDLIKNFSWFVSSTGYATTGSGKTQVYMHRLVMREYLTDGKEIDHANGNGLDNRKNNLRVCNHRENLRNLAVQKNNTSGYPGVYKDRYGNYKVMIMVDYKSIVVGTYPTFEQAVAARKRAEDDYHGEFAGHIRREMKNN